MIRNFINKRQWKALLKEPGISNELRNGIEHFLLPDKIDYEKYLQNSKANDMCINGPGLKVWEMANKLSASKEIENINCTPSFRKFHADNPMDRASHIHDWFYIAYPDVEVWVRENIMFLMDEEILPNKEKYYTTNRLNENGYRFFIDRYKEVTNNKLECEV